MNFFEIKPKVMFVENDTDVKYFESTGHFVKIGDILETTNKYEYIVKPLDTIQSVAKYLGVSVIDVENAAGGKSLFVGQKIEINF